MPALRRRPRYPWHSYPILLSPHRIYEVLHQLSASSRGEPVPNLWQVELGVLRMWHRVLFRAETVGTSADPVRSTWRARLLWWRPLRFPFLLWEQAIAPWDMSGFLSAPERICRHLLGAHHDRLQSVYDLHLLAARAPAALPRLRERIAAVVMDQDPRSAWLKDLVVHEGYHDNLLAVVDTILAGQEPLSPAEAIDPDLSFGAYLRWCACQPATPTETWAALRAGRYHFQHGLRDHAPA